MVNDFPTVPICDECGWRDIWFDADIEFHEPENKELYGEDYGLVMFINCPNCGEHIYTGVITAEVEKVYERRQKELRKEILERRKTLEREKIKQDLEDHNREQLGWSKW